MDVAEEGGKQISNGGSLRGICVEMDLSLLSSAPCCSA